MNVLWLPGWYPNKTEPYTGDFIQRHAQAVSLYHRVRVIHVVRDKHGVATDSVHEETRESGRLKETVIYYHSPSFRFALLESIWSGLRYMRLYRAAIRRYIAEEGLPAAAHVHIVSKNGWIALWLNKKYRVPLAVSEQWTIYLPEAKPGFDELSLPLRRMWRQVMQRAAGLSVVSHYLGDAMVALHPGARYAVIPNVVNDQVFFPAATPAAAGMVQFIHVSTLGYQKNPEAIINAMALVKQTMPGFRLSVFGPHRPALELLAAAKGLQDHIRFYAEVPQPELAGYMRQADALILYSRYETFGCVLIEANASGIPAIVSDIPVHHETISEGENGYFAEGDNAAALAGTLCRFMQQHHAGSRAAIAAGAREKYNYERVGRLFAAFYQNMLQP